MRGEFAFEFALRGATGRADDEKIEDREESCSEGEPCADAPVAEEEKRVRPQCGIDEHRTDEDHEHRRERGVKHQRAPRPRIAHEHTSEGCDGLWREHGGTMPGTYAGGK